MSHAANQRLPPRTYLKVRLKLPAELADEAAGVLVAQGSLGCAVALPAKARRATCTSVRLDAFFDQLRPSQLRRITRTLETYGMLSAADAKPEVSRIDDPWATRWMSRFGPIKIGARLLIVPPWSKEPPGRRLRLIVKPGQAFGTGHHPTTRGVLRVIEARCAERRFLSGLDVGSGSGILALAMRILGVERVVGIDNDPVALRAAAENAALNGLAGTVRFSRAPLQSLRRPFGLVVANIFTSTLIELAPRLKVLLEPGGRLILSGILAAEVADLMTAYQPDLNCLSSRIERGWATLELGHARR